MPGHAEEAPATAEPEAVPSLRETAKLEGHTQLVRTLAFDPVRHVLASGSSDRSLRIWDVETRTVRHTVVLPRGG